MYKKTTSARATEIVQARKEPPGRMATSAAANDFLVPDIPAQLGAAGQGHSFASVGVTPAPLGAIQPKLTVGAADDKYEDKADRVAGQVMRMPDSAIQRFADLNIEYKDAKVSEKDKNTWLPKFTAIQKLLNNRSLVEKHL